MPKLSDLEIKLFTDGADKAQIMEMAKQPWIRGFTTNPSLLKKAGVSDYEVYARDLVAAVSDRHISFEVFSDDLPEMVAQAHKIASWGGNVYVKLPVTNTRGEPLFEAVKALSQSGVRVNMTAIFTSEQVARAVAALAGGAPACVSVFAGRLADFGIDYRPIMRDAVARAADRQCGDHLGLHPRGLQHRRGRRDRLPHHHRAGRHPQEAAGARYPIRRRAVARWRESVPRRRALDGARAAARGGLAGGRIGGWNSRGRHAHIMIGRNALNQNVFE
jgi:transaldolase